MPVCVTVTHLDGFVLARSGFHHSINYRSVMAFGTAQLVPDDDKLAVLEDFVERLFPGRWPELRPPTRQEMKATTVLWMDLDEVSAKIRTGPPVDDEEDYALPVWAGVLPLGTMVGAPAARPAPGRRRHAPAYLDHLSVLLRPGPGRALGHHRPPELSGSTAGRRAPRARSGSRCRRPPARARGRRRRAARPGPISGAPFGQRSRRG